MAFSLKPLPNGPQVQVEGKLKENVNESLGAEKGVGVVVEEKVLSTV
jgi:hypothetical protein